MSLAVYQQRLVASRAQFVAFLSGRRLGKSYALTLAAAMRMVGLRVRADGGGLERDPDGCSAQYLTSHSELAAQGLLAQVHEHVERFVASGILAADLHPEAVTASSFRLRNGCEARALSDNPRTARGQGGDWTADEICFSRDFPALFASASLIAGPTLARPQGFRIRMASSAFVDNSFARLVLEGDGSPLDRFAHVDRIAVNVEDAVRLHGFPRAGMSAVEQDAYLGKMRAELGDDVYETELMNRWISASSCFFSPDLLERCRYAPSEHPDVSTAVRVVAGVDIARSARGNLTVLQRVTVARDGVMYAGIPDTMRGVEFDLQAKSIGELVEAGVAPIACDNGGVGMPVVEGLQKKYPGKIRPITFTAQLKQTMMEALRFALETGKLRLPSDPGLLRDLVSIRKTTRAGGTFGFDSATGSDGSHGDRAWSLALAVSIANAGSDSDGRVYSAGRREAADAAAAYLGDERSNYRGPAADWFPAQFGRGRGRPDRGPFG